MKRLHITLFITGIISLYAHNMSAQFVVAHDSIRGQINFTERMGDFANMKTIANDSVFYLYPPDLDIDPWRRVDFYTPSRQIEKGYIRGDKLMRVDDYELVEVSRLSAQGRVSLKNDDVKVEIAVAKVTPSDTYIKRKADGAYYVGGKAVKGVAKGETPQIRYQSISVSIKGKTVAFPAGRYNFLLEPEIDNMVVYHNPDKDLVYIIANNGGTKAYYSVLWQVSPRGVSGPYVFDPSIK
ncbi:hypothetical protein [Dysgonomonas sp. 511]|uniref:hypothetical protein n=1 Tax=Dysgonomonas sp. 511 TaxID=2302930 RepID=UPI0013D7B3CB|nr:hypothetical protein [Dysgonomonas sp. 511]NDV78080.1 hypothetical protein [Dysgonomonas sp. 511]